ncbi:MAG TPA: NAD(P)-dependent oxidoreductase [Ktedonobacteraceae bacterium]|nr:NAD(P)-dependent oxidoreductase [Ktedonobacteraceae bacterium]
MKILVTGGTGRIGSRFLPRLIERGHTLRLLIRDTSSLKKIPYTNLETVVGDVTQPETLQPAVQGMDAIVHLAARFRVRNDDEGIKAVTEAGAKALADAAIKAHVPRFVFVSTNLVYGKGANRPARENDVIENIPMAYPASKYMTEEYLRTLTQEHKLGARILRLAFVYGEQDPHLSEVLPIMQQLHWSPAKRLHMVHHADVNQALLLALQTEGIDGQTYNVGDDAPITAEELMQAHEKQGMLDEEDASLKEPWEGVMDTTKIRKELGFRPLYPSFYTAKDAGVL